MSLESTIALSRLAESCGLHGDALSVLRTFLLNACRRGEIHDVDAETRTQLSSSLTGVAAPLRAALNKTSTPTPPPTTTTTPPTIDENSEPFQLETFRKSLLERLTTLKAQVVELTSFFVTDAVSPETFVWAHKVRGDFHRYLAEASTSEKDVAAAETCFAAALNKAQSHLPPTSPLRLGAALNYAAFCHDILRDVDKARKLAHDALDEAEGEMHSFDVPQNLPDTAYVMQLMRRTLARWEEM